MATQYQQAGVDALWGAEKTIDYFRFFHGRNGIDGNGGPGTFPGVDGRTNLLGVIVHFNGMVGSVPNRYNAQWTSAGYIVCGDGDEETFRPLVSIDVMAHELTHGVTQYTARLDYHGEPGALNESISDAFGAIVEYYVTHGSSQNPDIWKIGEDFYTPAIPGDAIRYLNNPHQAEDKGFTDDDDPDHYDERYMGSADHGGVHINSGIPNKVFYLVSQGGTNHRDHSGLSIHGIGPFDAAKIWYEALKCYLRPKSSFTSARIATQRAAADIFGPNSPQYQAVAQAWTVCGVNE